MQAFKIPAQWVVHIDKTQDIRHKTQDARQLLLKLNFNSNHFKEETTMAFFNSAVTVLQTLVIALGAGLGIWGAINLMEGYGNYNRATRFRTNITLF